MIKKLYLILFVYLFFELISFVANFFAFSNVLSLTQIRKEQIKIIQASSNIKKVPSQNYMVAHPYFGAAYNSDYKLKYAGISINDFGLIDDKAPLPKKSKDKVVIGVFGGSVAWWLSANEYFEKAFQDKFKGKKIEIIRVALGAWKQPQQAQALSLLLQLGAEFDYAINVDGFNEIGLVSYNQTVNYFYPFYWQQLSKDFYSSSAAEIVSKITYAKASQSNLASFFNQKPFTYSYSSSFLWKLVNSILAGKISSNQKAIKSLSENSTYKASIHGPKIHVKKERFYQFLAKFWYNGSLLMSDLCKARGIKYFHFLQPNQYLEGSKVFTEKEKNEFIIAGTGTGVVHGYPVLKKLGEKLNSAGIRFFDASLVFKKTRETSYSDSCCHLNDSGERILTDFIVSSVDAS